jgi:5,10-methylenetetrahydromethanopterin reductase
MAEATVEIWASGAGVPGYSARRAEEVERAGFDGLTFVDSQNLAGDCYVALALAAKATTRLKLATGVTNPFTRHPAVTACAIASIQAESGGRAMLGIGRGDSALAHLGYAPAPVRAFERYLRAVQAYLRGDEVPFAPEGDLATLGLAGQPEASRLAWLRHGAAGVPKVPVDVAATGPKVIAMAATLADRITFAVGADPERLRWAIGVAHEARSAAGLDPQSLPLGAYVTVVVHPESATARQLGEGSLALFTRFSAMHGRVVGPASASDRAVFEQVHDAYDMRRHARTGSPQAALIDAEFAERFAIFGPADYCVRRLRELLALGLDRLVVSGPSIGADRGEAEAAQQRFVAEVLPALHNA